MIVIIPAYKPDEKLLRLIDEIHSTTDFGIVVVNDGSGKEFDGIFSSIPDYVELLTHDVNKGKGRAMKTAFRYCLEKHPDEEGIVIADADGQHIPTDISSVVETMRDNPSSVVLGSRRFTGKVPFRSRFGNGITRFVFAAASGAKVYDTQTGLRAIPMNYLEQFIGIKGERYEYEMNMLLYCAEKGINMKEVFIETVYIDDNASSHFHIFRDSIRIYAVIFKFIFASFTSYILDTLIYVGLTALLPVFAVFQGSSVEVFSSEFQTGDVIRVISLFTARVVSSLYNYFMNKKTVFKGSEKSKVTILKFYLVVALIYVMNVLLLKFFEDVLGMGISPFGHFCAQAISMLMLYPVTYILQRFFVFKRKR